MTASQIEDETVTTQTAPYETVEDACARPILIGDTAFDIARDYRDGIPKSELINALKRIEAALQSARRQAFDEAIGIVEARVTALKVGAFARDMNTRLRLAELEGTLEALRSLRDKE